VIYGLDAVTLIRAECQKKLREKKFSEKLHRQQEQQQQLQQQNQHLLN